MITDILETSNSTQQNNEFKKDILIGLTKANKSISSKYFYDKNGCELFNKITRHPDYYLTNSEIEILNTNKLEISELLKELDFNLIELGPGEGIKTEILIKEFIKNKLSFTYQPIDISLKYLQELTQQLLSHMPQLSIDYIQEDYLTNLNKINFFNNKPNFILFLGSSIGNFSPSVTRKFLSNLASQLNKGDYFLLGMDLRKETDILMKAYDDSHGITREFNMNLLKRINNELQADFDLQQFQHNPSYNIEAGAMESYLISLKRQMINIQSLNRKFIFDKNEKIHVESSYKYLKSHSYKLAESCGFEVVKNYTDIKNYFLDSLWRVK